MLEQLSLPNADDKNEDSQIILAIANVMTEQCYSDNQAELLWQQAKKSLSTQKIGAILLNSVPLDLTSEVRQLISMTEESSREV